MAVCVLCAKNEDRYDLFGRCTGTLGIVPRLPPENLLEQRKMRLWQIQDNPDSRQHKCPTASSWRRECSRETSTPRKTCSQPT